VKYLWFFAEVLRKEALYLWRYKINSIAGILFLSLICLGILFGAKSMSAAAVGATDKLEIIAGYIIWVVMVTNFQTITRALTAESTLGTFEQVYINATSMVGFLITKCAAAFVLNLATLYGVLLAVMLISGVAVNKGMIEMLPVIALGVPAVWGLGIGIGSLILFAKQVESLTVLLSTIAMASVPIVARHSEVASFFLPFGISSRLAQNMVTSQLMSRGVTIQDILLILLNDSFYLAIGLAMYGVSCYLGRSYGKLGHH
jgi:hypothetical protein